MSKQIYKKDVFISYSRNDKGWVDDVLLEHLGNAQISYFDQHRFEPGEIMIKALENAIEQSRCVLLIITSRYLEDSWDQFTNFIAFNYMLQTNATRVIPALTENVGNLPNRIAALVSIDLYNDDKDEWQRLMRALSKDRAEDVEKECHPPSSTPAPPSHDTRDVLQLLFEMREKPEVHGPFIQFEAEFRNMREQIQSLNQHKKLHDLFQQLEAHLNVISAFCGGPRLDAEVEWDRLEDSDSLAQIGDI